MVDARTTIYGNRLGLGGVGSLVLDGQSLYSADTSTRAAAVAPVAAGTSAATFPNGGVTTFGSTAAGAYILAAPIAGITKWLVHNTGSTVSETVTTSGATIHAQFPSTVLINSSLVNVINFVASTIANTGQAVQLLGISTSKWVVLSQNSTFITFTS